MNTDSFFVANILVLDNLFLFSQRRCFNVHRNNTVTDKLSYEKKIKQKENRKCTVIHHRNDKTTPFFSFSLKSRNSLFVSIYFFFSFE